MGCFDTTWVQQESLTSVSTIESTYCMIMHADINHHIIVLLLLLYMA